MKKINIRKIEVKKIAKKLYFYSIKYSLFSIPTLLVIILIIGLFVFKQTNNDFAQIVKPLDVPEIPEQIKEYMNSQSSDSYGSFDWFSFYDSDLGKKVSAKYSGSVGWHHSPLLNRSINYKFDGKELRLKSFSSESVPGAIFDDPFYTVFSEYSLYNIAKDFTEPIPKSDLVYLNGDKSNIMALWDDDLPNIVREIDAVEFLRIAQAAIYSDNKEVYERYFNEYWKERENTLGSELQNFFMDMLYTPLYYLDKEVKENVATGMNEEEYSRFLALASIFGSKHMEIHNLVYQPNTKNNKIIDWSPVVYDFMGNFTGEGRDLTPFISYNYFSEFFMRSPKYYYNYLKELQSMNQDILGKQKISSFYNRFLCKNVSQYPEIEKILALGTASSISTSGDINDLCSSVEKVKNYENIRYLYLNEQLDNSTMHWNTWEENNQTYLAIWNPSPIPVELDKIKCGIFNCTGKWKLTNGPGWEFDPKIIAPQMVRMEGGYANAGIPTSVVPQPYIYIYKWEGGDSGNVANLSFEVSNAVNNKTIFAVKDDYPMLRAEDIKDVSLPLYSHKLKINILNFNNSNFVLKEEDLKKEIGEDKDKNKDKTKSDWEIEVKSSKCKLVPGSFPEYVFDCSDIDASKWPYLLDYSLSLTYNEVKVREIKGEFYQDYRPIIEGEEINQNKFEKYRVGIGSFIEKKEYQDVLANINPPENRMEFQKAVAKQKNAYVIPSGSQLTINGDISLPDSVIFVENGTKLAMGPLAQIKAGVFIANGKEGSQVVLSNRTGLPSWYGIAISAGGGGYINYALISNTANMENGAINGEDLTFLKIANTRLELNSSGIKLSNCVLDISNTSFTSNRWFRVEAWAINTANSSGNIQNIECSNLTNCIISSDDRLNISAVSAQNIKSSVFRIEGASSLVNLSSISVNEVSSIITKQFSPNINYKKEDIRTTEVNYVDLIDLDSTEIYDSISKRSSEEFYQKYKNFLEKKNNSTNEFILKKDISIIKEDIIVPEEVTLKIPAGSNIRLENKTSIISYGKIIAKGTEKKKITFSSGDREKKPWGTILLRGDKAIGEFDYCVFKNGGGDYLVGFDYTGSLTAHSAQKLTVSNSIFEDNKNDDALNCKYSSCFIFNNIFRKNAMDAIDFDFAKEDSEVHNNIFQENGNDSIDISFSDVKIYENEMISSGDKGVSVGEESHPIIFNNLFKGNNIGVESKDSSVATVINNDFVDNKLHLNAYQKKKSFSMGGTINAFNNVFSGDGAQKSVTDSYSKISIDDGENANIYGEMLDFYDINKLKYGVR